MEIEQILDQISPLSSQSIQLIADKMQLIQLPKNTTLIDADKVEKKLYFIKKGIVRAYIIDDGKEIDAWILFYVWLGGINNQVQHPTGKVPRWASTTCRIPDDCMAPRRYPLLAARKAMRHLVDDLLGRSILAPGALS